MFELTVPTAAMLKSVTPRQEHHGEDIVVALSLRLAMTGPNTLLDQLFESPKLRHSLYMAAEGQEQLPGVEPSTPLLRFNAFEGHTLKGSFEGWTLNVAHGVDEDDPISLGGCKVDAFKLEAMQGGTVQLTFRVGTNDVSSEEIGLLCGKLGSEISITMHAPKKAPEPIDASSSAPDLPPDAGDLFAAEHGEDTDGPEGEGDSESEGGDADAYDGVEIEDAPQSVTIERSQPGTRTARGRDKTAAALKAGAH